MSTDPRIIRTRNRLRGALLALIEERDLPSINVQDITQRAEVNRTTFYLHYTGIEDLVNDAIDHLVRELDAQTRPFMEGRPSLDHNVVPANLPTWYTYLGERPQLFYKLFTAPIGISFTSKLQSALEDQFLAAWRTFGLEAGEGSPPAEVRARYGAGAILAVVSKWVIDGSHADIARSYDIWTWEMLLPLLTSMVSGTSAPDGNQLSRQVPAPD